MLKDIIEKYLEWCAVYKSGNTCIDYRQFLNSFLSCESEYTDESILDFIRCEKAKGNSPVTINLKLTALRSFGEWAYDRKLIADNVYKRIDKLPVAKTEKITVLDLSVSEIMQKAKDREGKGWIAFRDTAIMNVFIVTGCRVSELVNISLSDVDFKNQEIKIRHGKGDKERTVYLTDGCVKVIEIYLSKIKTMDNPENLLFISSRPSKSGSRKMSRQAVYSVTKDVTGEFGCHKLRHLTATTMLNNGVSLDTVQEVLGHSSINTTKIYAERDQRAKKAAALAMNV